MKNTLKYTFLSAMFLGFVACDVDNTLPEIKDLDENTTTLNAGSADFSKYVAIGASFTAGFTDNALFIAAQENSFPNTMAKKFAMANGGAFNQPLMADNIGGFLFGGQQDPNGRFGPRLFFNGSSPTSLSVLGAVPTTEATTQLTGDYNNYGIPGAQSTHFIFDGYAAFNPYFGRIASASNATIIGDAVSKSPTFFSLSEFGGNDVLGYAISGGDGTSPITPTASFDFALGEVTKALVSTGAKGVVANLPYITSLPHFTTVPYAPLDPSDPAFGAQIPLLNMVYGAINQVYAAYGETSRIVQFSASQANPVVIVDENLAPFSAQITGGLLANRPAFEAFIAQFGLPAAAADSVAGLLGTYYGQTRQATADDLLVLPSSSVIGTVDMDAVALLMSQGLPQALAGQFSVEGITKPLSDKWVLTPQEQAEIKTAVDAYNGSLQTTATANGYAFVDLNAVLQEASTSGLQFDNYDLNTNLVTGGLVGLDGIHLTARGYALMANKMLEAIDATYGSNFAEAKDGLAKAGDYPTNYSPTLR